ncbi:hypothetical protein LTR12_015935 [Friedmanniomyces endolithicus]|nr:hypothetical protein LTR74_006287 [Friedmanniomyces endolithicus]KAK1809712.1 hypothetical protein LTR12_015935 [Friedmanniomyces endolithicus]
MSGKLTTDVDKRLLRTTKFPPEFNVKVDMTKVNFPVIKRWVQDEIERILGTEDEVVMNTIFNLVEESRYPNIKELQISLNGFLDKDAPKFCHDLWKYCISAQEGPNGVPKELLEAKKKELLQEKLEEDRAREEAQKRQEADRERELEIARVRDRERSERGRGGGGRYGGRESDRPPFRRDSRSPPPRRRDDDFYRNPPRGDTYVPGRARRDNGRPPRRRRSPSPGRSPSRSPPPRRRRRNSSSTSPAPRRRRESNDDRSQSRERGNEGRRDKSGNTGRRSRSRSPPRRRRSRSPRRRHHISLERSRSPPPKRTRRPSRSRSRSPPRKKRASLAANDLMARKNGTGRDEPRLSRDISGSPAATESHSRRRNTSSAESIVKPTNAGAEETVFMINKANKSPPKFTSLDAAQRASKSLPAPPQQQERTSMHLLDGEKRRANETRAQLLKEKFLRQRREREALAQRKDSAASVENGKS